MASSDTSGKRTCGNIHNGISILLEVQSSSFQTICPFPLRVLPFASGSRSTRVLLSESKPGQTSLSLPLPILFFPYFSSSNSFFLPAVLPWNREQFGKEKEREKNSAIVSLSDYFAIPSFCSIFLASTRNEYFPPWSLSHFSFSF